MRKRITLALIALLTIAGLMLFSSISASAAVVNDTYHPGYVVAFENKSGWNLGVWYSNPPGVGPADNLWYPVGGGITYWTELADMNIGSGYACQVSRFRDVNNEWLEWDPHSTHDDILPIGDHGLTVYECYYLGVTGP